MAQDLCLQVKVPFCNQKCTYCGALSCDYRFGITDAYARALIREAQSSGADFSDYTVRSITISGGCPACLGSRAVDVLLLSLHKHFNLSKDCSIKFKLTPGMVSTALLDTLRSRGVNRLDLSLGTTDIAEHDLLKRSYEYGAIQLLETLLSAYKPQGLGIRLLVGIPGQTEASLRRSLQSAISANPEQISLTPLRLVENTALFRKCSRGDVQAHTDSEIAELYQFSANWLTEKGFQQYTTNHFAHPGKVDSSVLYQLDNMEQLGLGLGAVSRVDGLWYHNTANLSEYVENSGEPQSIIQDVVNPSKTILTARKLILKLSTPLGVRIPEFTHFSRLLMQKISDNSLVTENGYSHLTSLGIVRQEAISHEILKTAPEFVV